MIKLVRRDFDDEFIKPKQGRTVNVRKYDAFTVADFVDGTAFETQKLAPTLVPVTLNKHKPIPESPPPQPQIASFAGLFISTFCGGRSPM